MPPNTDGLHVEPLCKDELVVIVAPQHPWARRRHVQWSDLATQRAPTAENECQWKLSTYDPARVAPTRCQHIHESMDVRHSSAVMEMVKVGLGVALLPRWVVRDDVQMGTLKALPLGRGGVKRSVDHSARQNRTLSRA